MRAKKLVLSLDYAAVAEPAMAGRSRASVAGPEHIETH
jgi:hypothetical protein